MKTWVNNTKRAYQEGRLSEDKITLLDEIGLREITFDEPQRTPKAANTSDTVDTADTTKASRTKPAKSKTAKNKTKSKAKSNASTGRKEIRRKQWYENVELCRQSSLNTAQRFLLRCVLLMERV